MIIFVPRMKAQSVVTLCRSSQHQYHNIILVLLLYYRCITWYQQVCTLLAVSKNHINRNSGRKRKKTLLPSPIFSLRKHGTRTQTLLILVFVFPVKAARPQGQKRTKTKEEEKQQQEKKHPRYSLNSNIKMPKLCSLNATVLVLVRNLYIFSFHHSKCGKI